jgi:hypothetical protein
LEVLNLGYALGFQAYHDTLLYARDVVSCASWYRVGSSPRIGSKRTAASPGSTTADVLHDTWHHANLAATVRLWHQIQMDDHLKHDSCVGSGMVASLRFKPQRRTYMPSLLQSDRFSIGMHDSTYSQSLHSWCYRESRQILQAQSS